MRDHAMLPARIDAGTYQAQDAVLTELIAAADLDASERQRIVDSATQLVRDIRNAGNPGLMEVFLAEYGLSTEEGVSLMCLAEALLRVPDAETIDALIEDKIAPSDWQSHLGRSTSSLVNASTWGLMLTGRILDDTPPGLVGHLRNAIKRLGEPVIRAAVGRAMKEMGRQFVLGETIDDAMTRAASLEAKGYTYSYDMLGEAAMTPRDASRFHLSYSKAISAIAGACNASDIRDNPGISVKLSALYPRYEQAQRDAVLSELVPSLTSLALLAKSANMGLNVDAEEADRLSLSLEVIEAVLGEPALAGWEGFGVVVQAYGPRAGTVIETLYDLARRHDRRLMVRLVKGAYWDTEIKRAQVEGIDGFPVFTQKAVTDISYIANARRLLERTDRIYPQFATHNAHTVMSILHMAKDRPFEFQRLHGMGEVLHDIVRAQNGTRCRIYAPVGAHRDLLAYLVRRLLENGANSSFVNQIVNDDVSPEEVAADPFETVRTLAPTLTPGPDLFQPERQNSKGFDLTHTPTLAHIGEARAPFRAHTWQARPLVAFSPAQEAPDTQICAPHDPSDIVGTIRTSLPEDVSPAFDSAQPWNATPEARRTALNAAADAYEAAFGELFALLCREAGKTLPDAVAELREAVDFLRYYGAQTNQAAPRGTFVCISPWNFPLAIFTGQITAALAAGNAVIAKPAEQTPLIAARAVALLHEAGVPRSALQLLIGDGAIGAALTSHTAVDGVAFTGSTDTALRIRKALAQHAAPGTPLIAETGGLNAMIVDSTALPEQTVQAVIESAFQSAGQRCSALRCLYVQSDIAVTIVEMLTGAMDTLRLGTPWDLATDVGPVIDAEAQKTIQQYIDAQNSVLHRLETPEIGHFIAPTLIKVAGIEDLTHEVFGPVLHVATFEAHELDDVIARINATGYGLTFGLQTRIDDRVQHTTDSIRAGNIYVNRNQIGAIVGSQPFGGNGLSGTGPKAGGPHYLNRFRAMVTETTRDTWPAAMAKLPDLPQDAPRRLDQTPLPGPTGELNRLELWTKPALLCLGPGRETAERQAQCVRDLGGAAVMADGQINPDALTDGPAYGGALWWGDTRTARALTLALAARTGPIIPLITTRPDKAHVTEERHLCVDTTASGGNAALLGSAM